MTDKIALISSRKVAGHTIFWVLFIIYEQSTVYYINRNLGSVANFCYYYLVNIGVFYCHVILLNETMGKDKPKYFLCLLLTLVEMLVFMLIKGAGEYWLDKGHYNFTHNFPLYKKFVVIDSLRNIYYAGMATIYWTISHMAEFRKKTAEAEISQLGLARDNAQLETNLANTRNAYLQHQLNPHLLFNTLNFIYNSVYKLSEDGGKAVLLLAEIMRFTLKKTDHEGKVALSDEIEQLENLITINRYRYHYPLEIDLVLQGDLGPFHIIPLILLTLAENLFKHGDMNSHKAIVRLSVTESGLLRFSTANTKKNRAPGVSEKGIGIENTRLRLEHTYKNHYNLDTRETDSTFQLDLTIQL